MEKDKSLIENALASGSELKGGKKTYYIDKVLGAGGFGITYRAYSITHDGNIKRKLYYAIKEHFMKGCYRAEDKTSVLCPSTIKNDVNQSRNDFELEADRLMSLSKLSPNIVKVNEKFKSNGTYYYVMEYLDGGDLEKVVKDNKGPLTEAKALSLIVPIARAVSLLHAGEKRILHLDIKPDNIVMKTDEITGTSYPVLIDFGTAKHFDKKGNPTSLPMAKGATDGYAPIEQYTEISEFDARLDVYALGATLFFLLTGKRPIKAFDVTDKYIQDSLPRVSGRVRVAIMNAMKKDKSPRTSTVDAFCKEIEQMYALPLYFELHSPNRQYRIVEILSETDCSITYKAIVSYATNSIAQGCVNGNDTVANEFYTICEYYSKLYDTRLESGKVVLSDKAEKPMKRNQFSKENCQRLGIKDDETVAQDANGVMTGEVFVTNGTMYCATKKVKPMGYWEKLLRFFSSHRKAFKAFLIGLISLGGLAACLVLINSLSQPDPRPAEILVIKPVDTDTLVHDAPDVVEPEQIIPSNNEPPKPTLEELFAQANTIKEYRALADEGYVKAYAPLAELYLKNNRYDNAHKYAAKAIKANVGKELAKIVINSLEAMGYYDDKSHQKPKIN